MCDTNHSPVHISTYMSLADSCVGTPTMSDDEWLMQMEHHNTMGKEYTSFLKMTYAVIAPTRNPRLLSKCAYIMLLDPAKYIFIEGLSLRPQYRLFLLAIFCCGEGNAYEPVRKLHLANAFLATGIHTNSPNTQVKLYVRINRDGCNYAYVAENVHLKVGATLETLMLKHMKRWHLLENIIHGAKIDLLCDSLRESPVLKGLLFNTFLRLHAINELKKP